MAKFENWNVRRNFCEIDKKALNVCRQGTLDLVSLSHKGDQDIMEFPEVRSRDMSGT